MKNMRTLRFVESQERQHGRRNIAQRALLLVFLPILVVRERIGGGGGGVRALLGRQPRHNERDFIGRVRRVRRARLEIHHLFRVAMVSGDEQRVACFLARRIYNSDSLVRMRDRLYGGVELARVADLLRRWGVHQLYTRVVRTENAPCLEAQSYT